MHPLGHAVNGDIIPDEAEAVRAIYRLLTRTDRPESLRSLVRGLGGTEPIPVSRPAPDTLMSCPLNALSGGLPRARHLALCSLTVSGAPRPTWHPVQPQIRPNVDLHSQDCPR